jgi:predicted ArsR family transcriptional regulator
MPRGDLLAADPTGVPGLGESRARVLHVLQSAAAPVGVDEVARRVRLHPNTTRFHLDGLVEMGLAARASEERDRPGRPRAVYTAAPEAAGAGRRSYRLLAEILTSYLASQSKAPAQAAQKAGEAWGRFLTDRPAPFRRVDVEHAVGQLVATLDEIGFEPEAVTSGRKRQILLHHCPFRETAEEHREVVCGVHLGLMRGLLAELDAPIDAERLDPFVEPSLCVTHLSGRTGPGKPRPRAG